MTIYNGTTGADTLTGSISADEIYGFAGNDILNGGGGNDTLEGGTGGDTLIGGAGIDTASYETSTTAVTINLATGIHTGGAAGDVYDDIEVISGSSYGDTFTGNAAANTFIGGDGNDIFMSGVGSDSLIGGDNVDTASYMASTSAVTINLTSGIHSNDAAGDTFSSIEIFEGTVYADSFTGDANADIFIGGTGADTIDGSTGTDGAWYLTSHEAIQANLLTNIFSGGDAAGDSLINVENIIGSSFSDQISGNDYVNKLEGGSGSDVIYGLGGNDIIYGDIGSDIGATAQATPIELRQQDKLYGGAGDDTIYSAYSGYNYTVYGEDGSDTMYLLGTGYVLGGNGNDVYHVTNDSKITIISDTGSDTADAVHLDYISSYSDLYAIQSGDDLRIYSYSDGADGFFDRVTIMDDWFNGGNTIETFFIANGQTWSYGIA